ncbi:MAG: DEAD/DEAH box helicase family protein, partial [Oscillospiraceae bacterium]
SVVDATDYAAIERATAHMSGPITVTCEGLLLYLPAYEQKEVAKTLKEVEVATVKELCTICGVTVGVVNALYKKGIADFFYEEISYNSSPCINFPKNDVVLSDEQAEAFIGIKQLVDNNSANVALLNGVTGSGKTKVYIKLIEYVLSLEKTAIMLVPEISLTPQTAKNFIDVFGDIVCVIHSGLSVSERLNQFNKIKCGECKIVIGTRSAVFSPLENIGIIILDEEGENSYKSETTPRYHAREIAKFRAVKHNATLVLGSATPCIESYYYAKTGRYSLFTLDKRY